MARGRQLRLTTNDWYRAQQLGNTSCVYVLCCSIANLETFPLMIQGPAKHLDYSYKGVGAAHYNTGPPGTIERAVPEHREESA